jgi:hypothetical protein
MKQRELQVVENGNILADNGSCITFDWKSFDNINETLSISRLIQNHIGKIDQNYVSIDITPFPHPYFLQLLRILDDLTQNIRVFYVSPGSYYLGGRTIGVREIQNLHYGAYAPNKPILLIIFPGFSGETALQIKKEVDPHFTVVMLPKIDMWQQSLDFTSKSHAALFESSDVERRHISTADPFSVQNELEALKNEYSDYNWVVGPQGTKLQSLGLQLFARNNRELISAFMWAKPEKYIPDQYTNGIGQAYMAII